jgi:hypothetical protein
MDSKRSEKILNLNINNIYNELKKDIKENFSDYPVQNAISATTFSVNGINSFLSKGTATQNYKNKMINLNNEALIKKEELLKFENEDLMNQLKELENIQSTISNKERIIEQNNFSMEQENINIRVLIASIILAILLLIGISLYGTGKIDSKKLTVIVIIIIFLYIILFIYMYDMFYFRTALDFLTFRRRHRLIGSLREWGETVRNEAKENIYGTESEWISNNCACPANYGVSEEEDIYASDPNVGVAEIPGYMYYDGTAPQQILVPSPDTITTQTSEDGVIRDANINWVDYSPNGNNFYDPLNNKTTNDNNSFYNYKSTSDPTVLLLKELNESNTLVNNITKSANF